MARSLNWSPPQEQQWNLDHNSDYNSLTSSTDSKLESYNKQPTGEGNHSPSEFHSPVTEQDCCTCLITSPAYSTDSNALPMSHPHQSTIPHWTPGPRWQLLIPRKVGTRGRTRTIEIVLLPIISSITHVQSSIKWSNTSQGLNNFQRSKRSSRGLGVERSGWLPGTFETRVTDQPGTSSILSVSLATRAYWLVAFIRTTSLSGRIPSILPGTASIWSCCRLRSGTSEVQRTYLMTAVLSSLYLPWVTLSLHTSPTCLPSSLRHLAPIPWFRKNLQFQMMISSSILCSRLLDSRKNLSQLSRTGYYTRTWKHSWTCTQALPWASQDWISWGVQNIWWRFWTCPRHCFKTQAIGAMV